jgi:hypothetical protein
MLSDNRLIELMISDLGLTYTSNHAIYMKWYYLRLILYMACLFIFYQWIASSARGGNQTHIVMDKIFYFTTTAIYGCY